MEEKAVCGLLGHCVRRLRQKNGWTQETLAEKLDISINFLSNIENGKAWVSPKTVGTLSAVFGIAPHELFLREESTNDAINAILSRYNQDIKTLFTTEFSRYFKGGAE